MPEEEKVYTSMYSRNAELYHHGILGQKWGITNGPPYPLGSDISTGSRLKKMFSRDKGGEEVKKTKEEKDQIARAKALKKENKKMLKESKRDTVTSKAIKKAKGMTDEELRAAVNRLNFEKQYANLEKDMAELSKKNPSLAQKTKTAIKNALKEQISKTGRTVVNSVTSEINKKISETIRDKMDEKLEIGAYKPKNQNDENGSPDIKTSTNPNGKPSSKENQSETSNKESVVKNFVKDGWENYKQAWKDGFDDYKNSEPKMYGKEKAEAETKYKQAREYDINAEAYKEMYEDPNNEQYRGRIIQQYANAKAKADDFRKENKDILDKYERQKRDPKSTIEVNGHIYDIDDINKAKKKNK